MFLDRRLCPEKHVLNIYLTVLRWNLGKFFITIMPNLQILSIKKGLCHLIRVMYSHFYRLLYAKVLQTPISFDKTHAFFSEQYKFALFCNTYANIFTVNGKGGYYKGITRYDGSKSLTEICYLFLEGCCYPMPLEPL